MAEIINSVDTSADPYYSRFKPNNDWKLAFPYDRKLQGAELTEMEEIIFNDLGALGNTVLSDGDRVQGLSFKQTGNSITVTNGQVYYAGKVRNFYEQTVEITGKGIENVGIRLSQSVITSQDDSSLAGLAPNTPAQGQPGADRIKDTVELVVNDEAAATLYKFNNGELYKATNTGSTAKVEQAIGRHEYDSFGSYAIGSGFALSVSASTTGKEGYATLNIGSGKASIHGTIVEKPYATQIDIRQALDTEEIDGEQHAYVYDKNNTPVNKYTLNFPNVKEITLVQAQVQDTFSTTHSSTNSTDYVVDNLVTVQRVYTEGKSGRTYRAGIDYTVQGNSISWNMSGGLQPAVNASYRVDAIYNATMHGNGIDYTATIGSGVNQTTTIDFSKAGGSGGSPAKKPAKNGLITIDYTPYLYRADAITLNEKGDFVIHEGLPSRIDTAQPPILNDPLTLSIGTVMMYPNSNSGACTSSLITNMTFRTLNLLAQEVNGILYNQQVNSLNSQEIQKHNPMDLKGIFTDSFVSGDKFDESYKTSSSMPDQFSANAIFNTGKKYITLPRESEASQHITLNKNGSTVVLPNVEGHVVSVPYTEEAFVTQPLVTSTIGINNLNTLDLEGTMNLSPNRDSYNTVSYNSTDPSITKSAPAVQALDEDSPLLRKKKKKKKSGSKPKPVNSGSSLDSWDKLNDYFNSSASDDDWDSMVDNTISGLNKWQGAYFDGSNWWASDGSYLEHGTPTDIANWNAEHQPAQPSEPSQPAYYDYTTTETVFGGTNYSDKKKSLYMRTLDVHFDVRGLVPYADDLVLDFGGHKCAITPDTGYSRGSSVTGSIRALADGSAKGTFTIPKNVPQGKVEVKLSTDHSIAVASYTGEATYQVATDWYYTQTVTHHVIDPVAQTFQADFNAQITSINLKFAAKDNNAGVLVQMRQVSNTGEPTTIVVGSKFLNAQDVKVSSDGSSWTQVVFDDMIPIKEGDELAICVSSSSDNYKLWRAQIGEAIPGKKQAVVKQPYTAGIMFESSNNLYWSSDQRSDLAFQVNIAHYSTQPAVATFDPMQNISADKFVVVSTFLTPENTGCTWEYRALFDDDTSKIEDMSWEPIVTGTLYDAQGVITALQLRATLVAKPYVSPTISLSDIVTGAYTTALRGDYVSYNVDSHDSPFNTINISFIQTLPDDVDAAVIPQYSLDGGRSWIDCTTHTVGGVSYPKYERVDGTTRQRVTYLEQLTDVEGKQIKFHLKLISDSQFERPYVEQLMTSWLYK